MLERRRKPFGFERERFFRKGRRRVRRALEIDIGGLSYTFPFLADIQQVTLNNQKSRDKTLFFLLQDVTTDGLLSCYKDRPTCLANDMPAEVGTVRDLLAEN